MEMNKVLIRVDVIRQLAEYFGNLGQLNFHLLVRIQISSRIFRTDLNSPIGYIQFVRGILF
jgi:hypothetical protein